MRVMTSVALLLLMGCADEGMELEQEPLAEAHSAPMRRVRDDAFIVGQALCTGIVGCDPNSRKSVPDCIAEYVADVCYWRVCESPSYNNSDVLSQCAAELASYYPTCDRQLAPTCADLAWGPLVPEH